MLEIFIVLFITVADQITKFLTVRYLKPLKSVPLLEGLLRLTYVENRGAAFGILQNQRWFLIVLPVLVIGAMIFYLIFHRKDSLLLKVSLAVIIGGAIGNLIDRVFLGYVVDMFEFAFIDFPVFNVADIAVVCGAILLGIQIIFLEKSQA
jgi:signal peptidase II